MLGSVNTHIAGARLPPSDFVTEHANPDFRISRRYRLLCELGARGINDKAKGDGKGKDMETAIQEQATGNRGEVRWQRCGRDGGKGDGHEQERQG